MSTNKPNPKKKSATPKKTAVKKQTSGAASKKATVEDAAPKKKPGPKKGSTRKKAVAEKPVAKKAVAKKAAAPKPAAKKAQAEKKEIAKKPIPKKVLSDRQFGRDIQEKYSPDYSRSIDEVAKKYWEQDRKTPLFVQKPTTTPNAPSSPLTIRQNESFTLNVSATVAPKAVKRSLWKRLTGWMRPSRKRK